MAENTRLMGIHPQDENFDFHFGTMQYNTRGQTCLAVAHDFLAGSTGQNSVGQQKEWLSSASDEALADEAISGFGLDQWMTDQDIGRENIIRGFAEYRTAMMGE